MAEEKLTTIQKVAASNPDASPLSVKTAAKVEEKVESWWSLLTTPAGRASLLAIAGFLGTLIATFISGFPTLKVEVTNFPLMHINSGTLTPPLTQPVEKAEKVGIIIFSKTPAPPLARDATFWKQFADKGHVVQTIAIGTPAATVWKPYSDKAGPDPCFVVVDASLASDNYLGGYPLSDKASVEKNINAHIGK